MINFDLHKNFAYSTVLTPPGSGGNTSNQLTVQTGNGSLFPTPTANNQYNLVVWATGANPTVSNATIVRVTALSTDTFTFTRSQEGSSDRVIVAGDQVALAPTAKLFTDIETGFNNLYVYNVRDYGATGNGSTDDTTAVQLAITTAHNNTAGGLVYFPPGTYKITSALTVYSSIQLVGSAPEQSVINQVTTNANAISGTDVISLVVSNLYIQGPNSGTGLGIYLNLSSNSNTPYVQLNNLVVRQFGSDGVKIQTPIVSMIDTVVSALNGGYGFNFASNGTSVTFRNTFANQNTGGGYHLVGCNYMAFQGCAADTNSNIAYFLDGCTGIHLAGCGLEGNSNGIKVNNSSNIGIYNAWCYQNNGVGIYVTGGSSAVTIAGASDFSPQGGASAFVKVDSGNSVTLSDIKNTTANNLASGTVTTLNDGTGAMSIALNGSSSAVPLTITVNSSSASNNALLVQNGTTFAQSGIFTQIKLANATDSAVALRLNNAGTGNSLEFYNGAAIIGFVDKSANGKLASLQTSSLTDTNANAYLKATTTGSAVDWVNITNGATGNPGTVAVGAAGSDTNVNLNLTSKGTGAVQINGVTAVDLSSSQTLTSKKLAGPSYVGRTTVNDTAYAALSTDYLIAYTSLTSGRTVTLPTAVGATGQVYIVKDEAGTAGTNNITIATTGGQVIDGSATKVINANYGVARLYSNNANWFTF